ncbi:unnamed protein product [Sphagnum troendelagicum]
MSNLTPCCRRAGTVYNISPQGTEKGLEVQHTMDHQVDAHMEEGEGSNVSAKILTENIFQMLIRWQTVREHLARCLLQCVETDSYQIVKDELHNLNFPTMVWMGYEVGRANLQDHVNLTKDLKKSILGLRALLPAARLKMPAGNLEVWSMKIGKEAIHVATRLCYHIYFIWHLLVIAICRDDDLKDEQKLIFHEILLLHNEHNMLTSEAENTAVGFDNPDVKELMNSRSLIDNNFLQLVMNELAKQHQDKMLYDLWQMMQGVAVNNSIHVKDKAVDNANESTMWPCSAQSHFGRWVIEMEKPVLLMDIEGSYQPTNEKWIQNRQRLDCIRDLLPQVVRLKAQLEVKVDIQPNFIDLTVSINQVLACVRNNMVRKEKQTGHFPSRVYLSVVPVNAGLTGVTMTGSSRNISVKVGVTEKVQGGVNANIKAAPSAGFNFRASKTTASEVEGKPWQLEQFSEDDDTGSSLTWDLLRLHGTKFDRLNPMNAEVKSSIWQFGKRIPENPLQELPFASDGSVNFTAEQFSNVMAWRYPRDLKDTTLVFNIVGCVHTTCTQPPFWETRMMPFKCQLEQKLEA